MPKPRSIQPEQFELLRKALGAALRVDVNLASLTTFQIGGNAKAFISVKSADELALAVSTARAAVVDYFLLGAGANILIGDRGYPGLVIHNQANAARVENNLLIAESGAMVYPDIIGLAADAGLSGLEHYVGIPSTIGGALWQNLHFLSPPPDRLRTMFIAAVVQDADILSAEGVRKTVPCDYFEFGYDYSVLHDRADVVLSATFALAPAEKTSIEHTMQANLEWRGQRHPPLASEPSAGSIFRKIEGIGAGRLIDECGLKGLQAGGAQVSPRHANILINTGGATAADVCSLIMHIQKTVEKETGYWLEPEISFVGEFAPVRRLKTPAAGKTY